MVPISVITPNDRDKGIETGNPIPVDANARGRGSSIMIVDVKFSRSPKSSIVHFSIMISAKNTPAKEEINAIIAAATGFETEEANTVVPWARTIEVPQPNAHPTGSLMQLHATKTSFFCAAILA